MPEVDLAPAVPPTARWVKLHYELAAQSPGAQLIARLWSAESVKDAVVVRGDAGDVFVKLNVPQKLFYQHPVNVRLKLKVTAYKDAGEEPPPLDSPERAS
jgi:hypothetical protein